MTIKYGARIWMKGRGYRTIPLREGISLEDAKWEVLRMRQRGVDVRLVVE